MAKNFAKLVRGATPGTGVQLRPVAYGKNGIRQFLRDVVAMANASIDGARYIIVGAEIDKKGNKHLPSLSRDDFSGTPLPGTGDQFHRAADSAEIPRGQCRQKADWRFRNRRLSGPSVHDARRFLGKAAPRRCIHTCG